MIVDDTRNHNPTGIRERFQSHRNVDAISEDIIIVYYDVAHVDADTKLNTSIGRHILGPLYHGPLNVDSAADSVDNTQEFHKHPVAGGLDDPASMLGYLAIYQFPAMRLELAERAFFIETHQPTVAGNVGGKNRRQSPFDALVGHIDLPPVASQNDAAILPHSQHRSLLIAGTHGTAEAARPP